jgi:LuxR family transcriptional regulator, regulator of acetate metabolism
MSAHRASASDAAAAELTARMEATATAARGLLGLPDEDPVSADTVRELLHVLERRLEVDDPSGPWVDAGAAHRRALERLRRRYDARFEALAGVQAAIAALRGLTSPSAILARAPGELVRGSQLKRVVLSLVSDGLLIAEASHFDADPVAAVKALETIRSSPARLTHPLIEVDLLRRRRATIVTDAASNARVHRSTAKVMGWDAYVAAPIVAGGELIGALHADTGAGGRALDVLDGDVLWTFAQGVAEAYETASLRRSLRRQREQLREFIEWLSARSLELSEAPIELVPERPPAPEPPGVLAAAVYTGASTDDRLVFEGVLTRRELEILRLVSTGEGNSAIAAQLVISEATVKFHVVNILRKLRVSNRAQAAARYHELVLRRASA